VKDSSLKTTVIFISIFVLLSLFLVLGCASSAKSEKAIKEVTLFYTANTSGFFGPSG
jgi:hypothetical protein